jgi:transcriptional regulator with XRE-family HTH domain
MIRFLLEKNLFAGLDLNMNETLAEIIRARRLVRGMEREDLAAAVGCDARSIMRWESGAQPSARHLLRLREILDISIDLMDELVLTAVSTVDHRLKVRGSREIAHIGWSLRHTLAEMLALDLRSIPIQGTRHEGTLEGWLPVLEALPDTWRILTRAQSVVGSWHVVPLTPSATERLRKGVLIDSEITLADVETLDLPGCVNMLICAFVLDHAERTPEAFRLLFESMLDFFTRLADREVFLDRILAATWTPTSQLLCRRLGFVEAGALTEGAHRIPVVEVQARDVFARPELQRFTRLRTLYETTGAAKPSLDGPLGPRLVSRNSTKGAV